VTFEEFVDLRLPALLRYATMLTGDRHLAQDLVQETMIRVQLRWRRVSATDAPERYVRRMLTTGYIDLHRGSWLRRVVLRDVTPEPPPAPDHADGAVRRDEIWGRLAELPRRQRAAIVLRFYEDLADSEIADVLGCSVGTVRSYICRALTTLRAEWSSTTSSVGGRR
jgi:RNA polymerase sigma-70 factor (sigma-E family)